jgi:glycosyltransferase involved in cell wall biosynthesis
MKNILLVGNWSSDTGYAWWLMETFWVAIARKFGGQCRVLVCYPQLKGIPPRLAAENIEVVEFDFATNGLAELKRFLAANNIGCVYLTDRSYASLRYVWLRLAGAKYIILHDHTPGVRKAPGMLKRVLKHAIGAVPFMTADAYVAVSEQILQRLLEVACLPRRKCHLARNGVDCLKISSATPANIRQELGLPQDALLIVSSGRLTPYKSIHTIVAAAAHLVNVKKVAGVFFAHCGDGPERAELSSQVARLGLEKRCFFLGMRSDVVSILKAADIAVHPSRGEGLSLSILEFMCAGLPVIVSDDPTTSQTISNGITGLLFKTGDALDLADKLEYLIRTESARAALGAAAAAEVQQNYSLDGTVAALLAVFDQVVPQAAAGQQPANGQVRPR